MKKHRKSLAWLLLATMASLIVQSCKPQKEQGITTAVKQQEKLTAEQLAFLDELDLAIEEELALIEKEETKGDTKMNQVIDPSNPNNPFEFVGQQVQQVFECAEPQLEAILENPIPTASLSFSGSDNFVALLTNNNDAFTFGTDNFTLETWVRPATNASGRVFLTLAPTGVRRGFDLSILNDGTVRFFSENVTNPVSLTSTQIT